MKWMALDGLYFKGMTMKEEIITLGGGCFWCLEAVYKEVLGILDIQNGYCNGSTIDPTYEQVCGGNTGHNEVVRLTFETNIISVRQILEIFFVIHDPTTFNRQGNDVGTQYRSGIYYSDPAHLAIAHEFLESVSAGRVFSNPVVTELEALSNYWPAEDYHQNYYEQHPEQGYCAFVVAPKVAKFQKTFKQFLKT